LGSLKMNLRTVRSAPIHDNIHTFYTSNNKWHNSHSISYLPDYKLMWEVNLVYIS
jgi:hypothetical protein